jgi:hypothetical protein
MKTKQVFFTMLFFTALIYSCATKEIRKNFIVPVDLSNSRDTLIINWYREIIKTSIFKNLHPKDRIVIMPVDKLSEVWGEEIFFADYSRHNYTNEFAGLQASQVERQNFQDSVSSSVKLFEVRFQSVRESRSHFVKETDVLGALRLCKKYCKPEFENIIVLLCDMQQVSEKGKIDFEKTLNTEKDARSLIDKIEPVDLSNISVIVLTGPQTAISSQKFGAVKLFWSEYFNKCNASLIDYSSGATTLLEEFLSNNK